MAMNRNIPINLNHDECEWEDHIAEEEELIYQLERDDIVLKCKAKNNYQ